MVNSFGLTAHSMHDPKRKVVDSDRLAHNSGQTHRPQYGPVVAFSLVEIALCLGVVGFALISVVGVLPVGMETLKASRDRSTASQIAGRLAASLQNTDFTEIATIADGSNLYFDRSGEPTDTETDAHFTARMLPKTAIYGGQPANISSALKVVTLEVSSIYGDPHQPVFQQVLFVPKSN